MCSNGKQIVINIKNTILRLVKRFNETGSVNDRVRKQTRRILTEAKLDEISAALHESPRKSSRCLAQQTGVCKASAGVGTKLLKLKPYKIPSFHELQPPDYNRRLHFCNWMLEKVNNEEIGPKSIFFSDEAWFHLHGHPASKKV